MTYSIFDFVGNVGVGLLITMYFLLIHGEIKSTDLFYILTNLISAVLIGVSLWATPNLSSIIIECFWFTISAYGLFNYYKGRQ